MSCSRVGDLAGEEGFGRSAIAHAPFSLQRLSVGTARQAEEPHVERCTYRRGTKGEDQLQHRVELLSELLIIAESHLQVLVGGLLSVFDLEV